MFKTITITRKDAEMASNYINYDNCLLATSLKRIFPDKKINVAASFFNIDNQQYEIPLEIKEFIKNAYTDIMPYDLLKPKEIRKEISFKIKI